MYKVFIENIPVLFQKELTKPNKLLTKFGPTLNISEYSSFVLEVKATKNSNLTLELNKDIGFPDFFKNFQYIEASGGIVYHKKLDSYLFIHRLKRWDLPKGKIEKNETSQFAAHREIEEECGVSGLKLQKHLSNTFHTYNLYGKHWIKKTFWYYFEYEGDPELHPQKEEAITAAEWIQKTELLKVIENTYGSIKDVLSAAKLI